MTITIEIKYFLNSSEVRKFHIALGQTLTYRTVLKV
ncbi:element excision factor XisH family protein [Nostoc piscinale]|nr:element excision factor XisH family protein [Nostoc piscinale]